MCYLAAVSLGLSAPAAVPVEIFAGERRAFRLSEEIGTGGVRFGKAAPFEPGSPVTVRFALPGATEALELAAEMVVTGDPSEEAGERGAASVHFLDASPEIRSALAAYIAERLGIPPLP